MVIYVLYRKKLQMANIHSLHLGHRGGVPVKGRSRRFGLVQVDFVTQRHTLKRGGQLEMCRARISTKV